MIRISEFVLTSFECGLANCSYYACGLLCAHLLKRAPARYLHALWFYLSCCASAYPFGAWRALPPQHQTSLRNHQRNKPDG